MFGKVEERELREIRSFRFQRPAENATLRLWIKVNNRTAVFYANDSKETTLGMRL